MSKKPRSRTYRVTKFEQEIFSKEQDEKAYVHWHSYVKRLTEHPDAEHRCPQEILDQYKASLQPGASNKKAYGRFNSVRESLV